MKFLQEHQLIGAITPKDLSAAANDGDWLDLSLFQRALLVLYGGIGTAGQDPVFTVQQAQDNAGTGAKALTFEEIYEKVGTLANVGQFTRKTQAAANTYVNDVSAESEKLICVEIQAPQLDVANGFRFVRLQIPDVGAAAQIGCAFYILSDPKYAGEIPPAAQ